jgi:hypothetical protein
MLLILVLMAVFLWLGLSASAFDGATQRRLLVLIGMAVVVQFFRGGI